MHPKIVFIRFEMSENLNTSHGQYIPENLEVKRTVRVLDTGSKEANVEILNCLKDYDVRFLENVKIQYFNLSYSDKLDICRKIMSIYALVINMQQRSKNNFLNQRAADVLAFYMTMGYSKETKNVIVEALDTNIKNLNQINAELTKKMFLIRDPYNAQKRSLSPELQKLKQFFLDIDCDTVSCNIRFKKRKEVRPSDLKVLEDDK